MSKKALSVCAGTAVRDGILSHLRERLGPQQYNAWFRHGTTVAVEDGHVRISVANPFVANWVEKHYMPDMCSAVQAAAGEPLPVVMTIDPELAGQLRKKQLDVQADIVARAHKGTGRGRSAYAAAAVPMRYCLSDFVSGQSNRLAHSAALAVVSGSAGFNPLFIHGQCGLGKTHLLQGICNAAASTVRNSHPTVWRYVTGEQFTNEFVHALRHKGFADFRSRYRRLDLLAIDDVHFLASKKAIQEEFLHTFNAIQAAGKQIVLASDAHPQMVGELNAQLANRFIAGMVVKIDPPDKSTRLDILRRKSAGMNLHIAEDVVEYIARHLRGSVRELEGALFKLAALSSLATAPVNMEMARSTLGDHLSRTDSAVTLGDIEAAVSAFFGITPADMHSSRRTRTVSVARMVAMFLARRNTPMSYPEIGRAMGKNHSSVLLAVKRMEEALAADADLTWSGVMGKKTMRARKVADLLGSEL